MSDIETWLNKIKNEVISSTFISRNPDTGEWETVERNLDFLEAFMCCVCLAEDDRGLRLALPNDIGYAAAVSTSLLKNLSKYGYKITKE